MALEPGSRLGPYEIVSPLGAGGMGEVYRARDARLGREVAVKVLPEHLSENPEIRQRFEREARAVSSLNHPHICTLFDIGSQEGVDFLVMELLEGESLSLRVKKGPLPLAEALRIGIQIAGALEKAHRAGFAHRDLKPGNIMLTKSGAKLLDFGLARTLEQKVAGAGDSGDAVSATPTLARQLTAAPTADSPLTTQGAILGTIQYMAPEQLDGREADRRTDIFALGLVLYEMITGRRAFEADSQASLIAEIMKGEPRSPSEVSGGTPPALDRVLQACLRKDPDERLQSAHDLRLQLEWIAEAPGESPAEAAGGAAAIPAPRPRLLPWIAAGLAALLAVAGWVSYNETAVELAEAMQPVAFSVGSPFRPGSGAARLSDFALSPDGRSVAFVAQADGEVPHLWVRRMDVREPRRLEGTQDAQHPFWSPDSRAIGFFSQSKLRRVAAGGGPPQVICDWQGGAGGTWSGRGEILFGGNPAGGGIMRVPAAGGVPEAVTVVSASEEGEGFAERASDAWPVFLPGGRRFLFLRFSGRTSTRAIFLGSLGGGDPRKLIDSGFKAELIAPDWLIFVQGASLMARRVDLDDTRMIGEPSVIVDGIRQAIVPGTASFSVSPGGHIAFTKSDVTWQSRLTWYDREGTALGDVTDEGSYVSVSLSPDGRAASTPRTTGESYDGAGVGEAPVDIWNIDLERGIASRFTARPSTSDENPVWSPDGERIAWASHRDGPAAVYMRDAGGAQAESLLLVSDKNPHPIDWSPDGRYLLLHAGNVLGDHDLVLLDLEDPEAGLRYWVSSPGNQGQGQFSPDGRWVAYASHEGEGFEVFVRPFPSGDGRWQISGGGGDQPRWRGDGRELYYVAPDGTMMAVDIGAGPGFRASAPRPLFRSPVRTPGFVFYGGQASYDVAHDGQRFLINRSLTGAHPRSTIDILLNWPRPDRSGP